MKGQSAMYAIIKEGGGQRKVESGEVILINEALDDTPELINQEPYGTGWILEARMTNPAELDRLLSAADYEALLAKK